MALLLDASIPFAHQIRDKSRTLPRHDDVEKLDEEALVEVESNASSIVSDSSASRASSDASSNKSIVEAETSKEARVREAHTTYYPHPTSFQLTEKPIDEYRSLNVAIVGAGLSGITAGALLPIKVPGIKLTIFDKNADCSGTWFENTYPGVRCDIPAHVYQSSFYANTQWSEEYAQGPEIRRYWQGMAQHYDLYSKMRLSTKVEGCYWEPQRAQWRLEINASGKKSTEYFDFVVQCIGRFNSWKMPEYPGMDKYKGKIMHSSNYDNSFDPRGKRIATIGNGASGIQVTPALRKVAAKIDHYARSPTWIAGKFTPWLRERQEAPMLLSEEVKEAFREDPDIYLLYRKKLEDGFWRTYAGQLSDSDEAKNMPEKLSNIMRTRLEESGKPEYVEKLIPDFPPHCRRLTPGPGYLECLAADNVELIMTPMTHFTENGIVTEDGKERPVDAVICSTGANTDCAPPIPIVAGDFDLANDWKIDGKFGFPYSYLGVAVPGFPNLAFVLGPNPAGPTGTLVNSAETQIAYIAKMLRKMSSQGIKSMAPSRRATDDFVEYCDAFFPRTSLTKKCSSWSNSGIPGARIHGHWPGSAAHLNIIRRDPRWEDYEYTYVRPENRFAYFGNGWTKREQNMEYDMVSYLRTENDNDLRNLHELWWDM